MLGVSTIMKNPYEVLEIKEGSSLEEIKKAYRLAVKKYHPDQYGDNPLRDLAEDKMREINEAYDYLMKNVNDNTSRSNTYENNAYTNTTSSANNNIYQEIRRDLQGGNLGAAEEKLNRITTMDAEWNYLMGILCIQKGWQDNAYNYLVKACNMNPNNFEYRQALNNINRRNSTYRQTYTGRDRNDIDICNICTTLYCMDCICECFGGDLISCC